MKTSFMVLLGFVVFGLVVVVIIATISPYEERSNQRNKSNGKNDYKVVNGYKVVNIDGCEYLVFPAAFSHKGNCTNRIHIYRTDVTNWIRP